MQVDHPVLNPVLNCTPGSNSIQQDVEPAAHLDVAILEQQKTFLNPRYFDVLSESIMYDCKGKGAMQLLAKWHIDMVSSNVSSYSRLLNGEKQLKQLQDYNKLAAAVALVSADAESDKAKKAANAKKKSDDKQ